MSVTSDAAATAIVAALPAYPFTSLEVWKAIEAVEEPYWAAGSGGVTSLNAQTGALTIQGTTDQIGVTTVGTTITVKMATTQPAGQYVMQSNGAGAVSWVPFEAGGLERVEVALIGFWTTVGESAECVGITLTAIAAF